MNLTFNVIFLCAFALCYAKDCSNVKRTNSKLICYYSSLSDVDNCFCTHLIIPSNTDLAIIKQVKQKLSGVKILLTVNDFNEGLVKTIQHNDIDGLELSLKKLSSKDDISEFINTVRTKLGNDLFLALSIPPNGEHLAKYYDLKSLTKSTDLFIVQTAFLGASKNVTFHPSRLSGLWDMQNTDSVVDLVTGMGAPLSRLVIAAPVQAFQFALQESTLTTPGSPALKLKTISRKELCEKIRNNNQESWTVERDQDQAGPYIFRGSEWIAFEDSTSMDIKAKYARVRGLAGLALKDVSQDITSKSLPESNNGHDESFCQDLLTAAYTGLSKQNRAPRQVVLRSLEREILDTPTAPHVGKVNVSPYRITRVVDVEGHVHSVRKDTRTEFECSRQGYFVHPHSCSRFYRCVKFDQLVDEFSVFEFDCPAGLVFDERVEVCVWPGNLPDGAPCHGSSEIAPVPKNRFACPSETGYYADPENCRWFFACLDHGKSGMTAYEFRCPFGLVFDEKRLLCEWPWLVPTCGSGYISGLQLDNIEFYGGSAKSTIIPGTVNHNQVVRVHLQPQVNVLDSYDGLGSLGTVALGGYNGDINLLKENFNHNVGYTGYASGNLAHVIGSAEENDGLIINAGNTDLGTGNLHLTTGYVGNAGIQNLGGTLLSNSNQEAYASDLHGKLSSQSAISSSQFQNYGGVASASSDDQSRIGVIHFGTGLNDALNAQAHGLYGAFNGGSEYVAGTGALHTGSASLDSSLLLLDADLKKQQLSGAKSSSTQTQYFDKTTGYDNSDQKVLVNADYSNEYSNQNLHLVNTGVDLGTVKISAAIPSTQLEGQIHSGNLGYNYEYADQAHYKLQPVVSYPSATKSTHNSGLLLTEQNKLNYASNYLAVTPKTDVFKIEKYQDYTPAITKQSGYSTAYQYQAPAAEYEQKLIQPIATEIKTQAIQQIIPVSSYHYQAPDIQVKQQEIVQPVLTQIKQDIPLKTKQQTSGYSSSYHYQDHQTPSIQYEKQPVVTEIRPLHTVVPLAEIKQPAHSATYQYQQNIQPVVHYEQQKIQPIVTEYKYKAAEDKQTTYSNSYQYQAPSVQLQYQNVEQPQEIVTEIKIPIIQQEAVVPIAHVKPQQSGYSHSYQYQAPSVQLQYQTVEQPEQIATEIKTPIIQQETIVPVAQVKQQESGYLNSYNYQTPSVKLQYENVGQPQKIITPIIQQETVVPLTPIKKQQSGYSHSYQYQAPSVELQYEKKLQPQQIITEIKTPTVQQQAIIPEVKLQSGYSSTYHYQAPTVQYEKVEQPQQIVTEIKTPTVQQQVFIPEVKQQSGYSSSYHYQAPSVEYQKIGQPQQIVTEIKTPIIQQETILPVKKQQSGYSHSYHYQAPSVQLQYEKEVQPQQIITEIKTPTVQQQVIIPEVKLQSGYSSTYHYQAPTVQYEKVEQPQQIVTEIKTPTVQQQVFIPEVKQQSGYSSSYHYQAPSVEYEKIGQPQQIVTEIKTPIIQQETILPVKKQQSGYSHSYHYQAPSVQLQYEKQVQPQQIVTEIKTPVVQQQIIIPDVKQQSEYSSSYHYQAPSVQYKAIKAPIIHQEVLPVAKTYHAYESPVVYEQKVQPIVQVQQPILETKFETPIVSTQAKQTSFSSTYHYQEPSVQYEPQKIQPIVQYEQKLEPIVTKIETPVVKQNSYSSIYHHQSPPTVQTLQYEHETQQPIIQYEHIQPIVSKIETPVAAVTQTGYSSSYRYQQPTVQYQEKVQPVVYEQNIQPVVTKIETPVVTTQRYQYEAPVVKFEQKVVQPVVQYEQNIQPVVQYEQKVAPVVYKTNYDAGKSHSQFYGVQHNVETVAVTPKYETVSVTPQYKTQIHQYYDKRIHEVKIPIVQKPTAFVTPKYEVPVVQQQFITPKVETSYYSQYVHQPEVEQKVLVSSTTPKYEAQFYGAKIEHKYQPISYEGQVPVVEEKIVPVKTYQTYSSTPIKQVVTKYDSREYLPPKPIVNTVYVSSTPKPQIYIQPKAPEVFVSTTPNYGVFQEYVQPKQTFEIKKKVVPVVPTKTVTAKPAIVESYSYIAPQPEVTHIKQDFIYSTPKSTTRYEYVQPKTNLEIKKPSPTVISQYEYINPEYENYESKLNLNLEEAFDIPKSTIEQHHTQTTFYSTLKPEPVQVLPVKNYQTEYIVSTPRPTLISTIAPIVKQTPTIRTKVVAINKYQTYDNNQYVSTPKQIYISTPAPVVNVKTVQESLPEFRYYDSRLNSDYKIKQEKPVQYFKEAEYYNEYDYTPTEKTKFVSTVKPVVVRKKISSTTTPIPLDIYSEYPDDGQFDSQYIVEAKPTIATTYRPQIAKYVVSTTASPQNFYYEDKVLSTVRPVVKSQIVTTTKAYKDAYNSEYIITTSRPKATSRPIVKKKKIIVTTTTEAPEFDYDEYVVSSEKPKYESIKITPRPKAKDSKTVVRVNDFHPFLTTKLGAQCTCVSNTVKLRKGSKEKQPIVVEDYEYELPETVPVTKITSDGPAAYDDYNEPGVYVVGNSDIDNDYDYDLKKIVTVTKTPKIKSTTNAAQPAPTPIYTIRKKVTTARPEEVEITSVSNRYRSRTSTATTAEEVFLRKAVTPAIRRKDSRSKEEKIAEAVNEGLSLVKSAVKSAVKEAIDEESRKFDRYGPGGWRSRDETLQGSVDCKREGLFRHPTQCNKFYACHWDCKKDRYTLHVFNCPVHLTFDTTQGACNWPSKGPACTGNTLLPNA